MFHCRSNRTFTRTWVDPTNARTDFQELTRGAFGTLATAWRQVLDNQDKAEWYSLALTMRSENRLCQEIPTLAYRLWMRHAHPFYLLTQPGEILTRPPDPLALPEVGWIADPLVISGAVLILPIITASGLDPERTRLQVRASRPLPLSSTRPKWTSLVLSHGPGPNSLWAWNEPGDSPTNIAQGFRYGPIHGSLIGLAARYLDIDGRLGPWSRITRPVQLAHE